MQVFGALPTSCDVCDVAIFLWSGGVVKDGYFFRHVCYPFKNKYNIILYNNPLESIISRETFVQKNEKK